jgi:hypothetical protein
MWDDGARLQAISSTTLFATLNVKTGTMTGRHQPSHRHDAFLKFLNSVDDIKTAIQESSRPTQQQSQNLPLVSQTRSNLG